MTLAQRNLYFKSGIFLSSLSLLLLLALTGKLLPLLPEYCEAALYRSQGFFHKLTGRFFAPAPQVPFVSLFAAALYALFVSVAVFFKFEKTHAPEILFFGLFGLSFLFEILRIMPPLGGLYEFSPVLSILGTRLLIFGRLFGVLSLLASSVYAAGFDMQKQGKVIIAIVIAILLVSFRLPVDRSSWDTTFTMLFAYSSTFRFTGNVLVIITIISFLIASHIRGTADYRFIALGALLVSLGRSLLIGADTWVTPFPGLIMLSAGTWIIITRLHQMYLWS